MKSRKEYGKIFPPYKLQRNNLAMKYKIDVAFKKEILDPEARAIEQSLRKKGFSAIKNITISKTFFLELEDKSDSLEEVENLARNYLTNPLSETYAIQKIDAEQAVQGNNL